MTTRGRAAFVLAALAVFLQLGGCASAPERMVPVEDRTKAPAGEAAKVEDQATIPQQEGAVIRPLSRSGDFGTGEMQPSAPRALEYVPMEPGEAPAFQAPGATGSPLGSTPPRPVSGSGAVVALLDNAGQQARSGQLDTSAATLERALRIEPDNAVIWNRLALVRLQQGRPDQAESLAAKSNALAGSDRELQVRNWRIIAQARRARGNKAGAQLAEERVLELAAGR